MNGTAGLALIGASGIGLAMLVMCTLLPALLAIVGRRAFWPFIPRYGSEGADATHGVWRRIAERVGLAPRRVWIGSITALVVMSLGLVYFNTGPHDGQLSSATRRAPRAARSWSRAPSRRRERAEHRARAEPRNCGRGPGGSRAARRWPVGPIETAGPARASISLAADPYSTEAFDQIPDLRDAAKQAGGDGVLIGGPTAEERDLASRPHATRG